LVVFVREDVAAIDMWQKTEDVRTDGLEFLPGNVLVFVLYSPNAACFESAVYNRSPIIPRIIAVNVCCLDKAVDVVSIYVAGHVCPPVDVAT
jgi:hypothetical protein